MIIEPVKLLGKEGQTGDNTHPELNKNGRHCIPENCGETGTSSQQFDNCEKPYVGMEFESEEVARSFYDAYANRSGFGTQVCQYHRSKPNGPVTALDFVCSSEGSRRKNDKSCSAILRLVRKNSEHFVVTKFVDNHSHPSESPKKVHCVRPQRHISGAAENVYEPPGYQNKAVVFPNRKDFLTDANRGIKNTYPVDMHHFSGNTFLVPPVHFIQPFSRKRSLGNDAQNLLNYFQRMQAESPGFYYAIQLDAENRMANVFWADARSRAAYRYFGDAVMFDTMYRPNQFQVPCASFTGVNHHGQIVLFGCALILDESESSFTWLFRTWLSAMNNPPPVSITTDQDRVIKAAINQVLPETRHRVCKWHILREGQERLSHLYLAHHSLHGDLFSCINFSTSIDDFESAWISLLDRYDLHRNEWLQAVYKARMQWAPVYFRDTFFAALSLNHGVGYFFHGYVNQHTPLPVFFEQYERALDDSLQKEIQADYETISSAPLLKTPSPMEQQASTLYTKNVFAKFQEELVETFVYTAHKVDGDGAENKYRVTRFENAHNSYIVRLHVSDMKASCSCQMFEYSGVLCRHILTVFRVTNILTLPPQFVLQRWTMSAKREARSDPKEKIDGRIIESLSYRFNNLCREALKFSEAAAISAETYSAAMRVLEEGARKVDVVKKDTVKIRLPTSQLSESSQESNIKNSSDVSPLRPCQEPQPNCFNIDDIEVPIANLSQPTMAPVAINHNGKLADNTIVLTCFKSMTWIVENKVPGGKVAAINIKLQDCSKLSGEDNVEFRLTRVTLIPMLTSLAYINQQFMLPTNKVAVISLRLQDTGTTVGESDVKFQVSRDSLGSMLRSMAYILELL